MYTLIGYKPCSTCRAIEKNLKNLDLPYQYREITEDVPSGKELWQWYQASGESSIKRIMNTSGTLYRELNMKSQLAGRSEQEQLELIAQDGMLIKRPILLAPSGQVYIGKKVAEFLEAMRQGEESSS